MGLQTTSHPCDMVNIDAYFLDCYFSTEYRMEIVSAFHVPIELEPLNGLA
jgi:hypothetical protein